MLDVGFQISMWTTWASSLLDFLAQSLDFLSKKLHKYDTNEYSYQKIFVKHWFSVTLFLGNCACWTPELVFAIVFWLVTDHSKMSKKIQNVKMLVISCLLITLIKCLKGTSLWGPSLKRFWGVGIVGKGDFQSQSQICGYNFAVKQIVSYVL